MHLCDIAVRSVILPLQILLLNQAVDVPLDATYVQRSPALRHLDRLSHQLGMRNVFPRLQDPHNRSLRFVVPICGDTLVCLLVLGGGLFELNRVDLDTIFSVRELFIYRKFIRGVDVAAFGVLRQGAKFGAGQRLQGAVEFGGC